MLTPPLYYGNISEGYRWDSTSKAGLPAIFRLVYKGAKTVDFAKNSS